MESKKDNGTRTKSLKGVFSGQASRVKHRFSSQMGEIILTKVRGHLRILKLGLKGGTEDDHEQRVVKNPLLYTRGKLSKLRSN